MKSLITAEDIDKIYSSNEIVLITERLDISESVWLKLSKDRRWVVRAAVARSRLCSQELITHLSQDSNYEVRGLYSW